MPNPLTVKFFAVNCTRMKSIIFRLPLAFTLVSCSGYFFDPEDGGDIFPRNFG
jgi:hypothetical protein